jgi:gamma-tubulin complex component 2
MRFWKLRDGSSLSAPSKRHQAGVPPPRTPGGRLPGGACIPPFLESWKHKILLAGKYLNVIRECGIEIKGDAQAVNEKDWDMDGEKYAAVVLLSTRADQLTGFPGSIKRSRTAIHMPIALC